MTTALLLLGFLSGLVGTTLLARTIPPEQWWTATAGFTLVVLGFAAVGLGIGRLMRR